MATALAALPLAACSGAAVVNALTPRGGYTVQRDLAYGPDPRQRLDLYVPDGAAVDQPLLVFFYGGNWQSGSKDLYRFVGQAFASRGYVTAIPDYRLYPQVRYPAFIGDGAAAVTWLIAHPEVAGRRKVVLVGHSAGAYIAAMLALDRRWLGRHTTGPCARIAAMAGLAGPYDFLPLNDATLEDIFGPGPTSPDSQPVNHVTAGDPPMLLATGSDDGTVRPRNSETLARRLRDAGVPAELVVYDGVGHVEIVAALAAPLRFLAPVLDDVDGFLRRQAACASG
ncbi:MAG: alpha/beta hydrolase [Geminicoccaceae bacterium]